MTARSTRGSSSDVWHLEPSLTDPDTVYAGVEDAALFRSTNGGKTWKNFPDARARNRAAVATRRGRNVLAHDLLDPKNAGRIVIAISAAGAFRSDDAGKTWKPINKGLKSQYIPDRKRKWGTVYIT
jgi:photosystem II stability/assembly factor-like uncharacterized protein